MRGISVVPIIVSLVIRFNPAYAGNIIPLTILSRSGEVQPRVCGEYIALNVRSYETLGSTPRMRGIFFGFLSLRDSKRFNPAYAGNIICDIIILVICKVQPRVCGEYFIKFQFAPSITGSTPRMRGILYIFICHPPPVRFNPAYAGNISRLR